VTSIIYGPVSSWRLGRSLGIDLLSTNEKTCSFDCIYCQLGRTIYSYFDRKEFVTISQLIDDLSKLEKPDVDYVTFSGVGEPTLADNLGAAINIAKSLLELPVAVLTNSSLLYREEVREELANADVVVAKLDAPDQEIFSLINRPVSDLSFQNTVDSIKKFRSGYNGKFVLQIMFIDANKKYASKIAALAKELHPDEVQINTPLRPCGVKSLPEAKISQIKQRFSEFHNVITVYEAKKPGVVPLDLKETMKRRPKL
jgi:wyosine [tRNA(Phe)-imidazoG37] synthetase (radical SAM superfamily)